MTEKLERMEKLIHLVLENVKNVSEDVSIIKEQNVQSAKVLKNVDDILYDMERR